MQALQRKTRTEKLKSKEMVPMTVRIVSLPFLTQVSESNSKTFLPLKFKLLGTQIKRIVLVRKKLF
jgi:hypothetical protein